MGNSQSSNTEPEHSGVRTSPIHKLENEQEYMQEAYLPGKRLATGGETTVNHSINGSTCNRE